MPSGGARSPFASARPPKAAAGSNRGHGGRTKDADGEGERGGQGEDGNGDAGEGEASALTKTVALSALWPLDRRQRQPARPPLYVELGRRDARPPPLLCCYVRHLERIRIEATEAFLAYIWSAEAAAASPEACEERRELGDWRSRSTGRPRTNDERESGWMIWCMVIDRYVYTYASYKKIIRLARPYSLPASRVKSNQTTSCWRVFSAFDEKP